MATFTGVIHYDPQRRRSLTAVTGWRSAWASDGLNTPGPNASRYDLYDEIGDDELEARWMSALPDERLNHRFAYGVCGVSPVTGWWAVLYKQRRQVDALLAHGGDARAADALAWPALAIGLDQAGVERLWPALGLRQGPAPDERRWLNDPPLYTPTALVHRMLAAGVAPITMMTSNLELIDRRAVTFDGVPWFGFHRESSTGLTIVIEASASGHARRLGVLDDAFDQIMLRSWGATSSSVAGMRLLGIELPAAFDRLEARVSGLVAGVTNAACRGVAFRLPAPAVDAMMSTGSMQGVVVPSPPSAQAFMIKAERLADQEALPTVASPADRLLAKPPNLPHASAQRPLRPAVGIRRANVAVAGPAGRAAAIGPACPPGLAGG